MAKKKVDEKVEEKVADVVVENPNVISEPAVVRELTQEEKERE